MRRSIRRSPLRRHLLLALRAMVAIGFAFSCGIASAARANFNGAGFFHGGLRNSLSRPLSAKQLQTLLKGLSFWTGLTEMRIDEAGFLNLGDRTRFAGGSATARSLLIAAVDSHDSFVLENHNQSPAIAFAQIEPIADYEDATGIKHVIWLLKMDFYDFTYLRGGGKVIAAFDPAINLLHELGHGVLKKPDTVSRLDQLGDCERYINLMRVELGLPERQNYYPQGRLAVPPGQTAQSLQAELTFVQTNPEKNKKSTFFLSFNVGSVSTFTKLQPGL